ncbi:MAG: Molybdopterin-guanine dinucleotide biosynthesis adapter protein [Alphaproteobacteria bacterium MarineAlpha5_Bin5]|nr:MAG: Molybdopterin-guanine dinucleotide biosynthesis adapter protein [Alphaproteobacteria bacterium MarineAlpha5_Bin5]PPR52558.1 MAG: Molybdopterin-guanine dinucleotide biosynthesis adapter protein [Alphaproteobacteria bacterium MarineAlpha5_Bin4]|tara:strand:- start:6691 stop:7179 length:489 start_codon:yes stop_codon:yes gene_type:complete
MKIVGIIGWKNVGKTYFAKNIIKNLRNRGCSVASVKHAHHEFDIDHQNTDSYAHREAGSSQVIVSSSKRWVKITELENNQEKNLNELINQLSETDIVIVEGYKNESHPKIEVVSENNDNYLYKNISNVIGLISDKKINCNLPQFKKNEINLIVNFILNEINE